MSESLNGQLVIVGTPIGNLADWSPRAQQALASVALIACEDTRRTGSLLAKHGIANPGMVVMNEHTERSATQRVLDALHAGERVAIVTDAGMPAISDPGAMTVAAAADSGFDIVVVPGPTAVSSALALSGFVAGRWVFDGFLPRKGRERSARIAELADEARMIVLYEAPHRIERTLTELAGSIDPNRACIVAREITKLHESVWRGPLADAAQSIGDARGEYVIVIDAARPAGPVTDADLVAALAAARSQGLSSRDATHTVASTFGVSRRRVYELANYPARPEQDSR